MDSIDDEGTSEPNFRWIEAKGIRLYTCYWTPNTTHSDFEDFISRLDNSIRTTVNDVLIAGDFNAKHNDWGSRINDVQGDEEVIPLMVTINELTEEKNQSPKKSLPLEAEKTRISITEKEEGKLAKQACAKR